MHEPQAMEFWLDETFDPAPELNQPGDAGQLVVTESLCLCRRVLDTFDHRLLSAGWLLAIEEGTASRFCVLQDNAGQRWEREWSGADPLFWRDLASLFPVPLAELIDVRALLPQLELRGERKAWIQEDSGGPVWRTGAATQAAFANHLGRLSPAVSGFCGGMSG